jgi:hypothetical protein
MSKNIGMHLADFDLNHSSHINHSQNISTQNLVNQFVRNN